MGNAGNTTIVIAAPHTKAEYESFAVRDAGRGSNPPVSADTKPSDTAVTAARTDSFSRSVTGTTYEWQSLVGGRGRVA
jgi:hypothetical protein